MSVCLKYKVKYLKWLKCLSSSSYCFPLSAHSLSAPPTPSPHPTTHPHTDLEHSTLATGLLRFCSEPFSLSIFLSFSLFLAPPLCFPLPPPHLRTSFISSPHLADSSSTFKSQKAQLWGLCYMLSSITTSCHHPLPWFPIYKMNIIKSVHLVRCCAD